MTRARITPASATANRPGSTQSEIPGLASRISVRPRATSVRERGSWAGFSGTPKPPPRSRTDAVGKYAVASAKVSASWVQCSGLSMPLPEWACSPTTVAPAASASSATSSSSKSGMPNFACEPAVRTLSWCPLPTPGSMRRKTSASLKSSGQFRRG